VLGITPDLKVASVAQYSHEQISTKPGWVEHDPQAIYSNVIRCLKEVIKDLDITAENVRGIGITNQRETTVAFNSLTGLPLHNALVWLDKRTSDIVDEIKAKHSGDVDMWREDCGLPVNTYFSAVKMRWLLENAQAVREEAEAKESNLKFGTIDSWLIAVSTQCSLFSTLFRFRK